MQPVQFDPKVTTDLPINWQRPSSGQGSDLFADLLADRMKRTVEADRRQPAAKRHQPASDPLSARPPRVVVSHARTVRGEAKEVEDTGTRLPDQRHCATEETCAAATEETPQGLEETAEATPQADADESEAEPGTEAAEEAAAQADQPAQSPDATVAAVVATQPAGQTAEADGEQSLALAAELPIPTDGQALVPEASEGAQPAQDGSEQAADAAMEQQAFQAAVESGLADVAIGAGSEGAAPVAAAGAAIVATQPGAAAKAAGAAQEPLLQIAEVAQPITQPAQPTAQPQADRHAAELKIRPSAPRPQTGASDPKPGTPAAAPSAQMQQPAPLQPSAVGEFGSLEDTLGQPFSSDGSGPGWALHLAQGAAGKRHDFVAQLRQHLQNLPAHEQVAVHVQRALRDGTGKFSVQLSPAELGRIHVKLEIDEDKRVTASVTVERPSTLELLQRDIKGLERALHNAGLSLESGDLSFNLNQGAEQDFAQDFGQSTASAAGGLASGTEAQGEEPEGAAAQVMDTAAGVVNLQV